MLAADPHPDLPYQVKPILRVNPNMLNSFVDLVGTQVSFAFGARDALKNSDHDIIHDHGLGCYLYNKPNVVATIHSTWWGERQGSKGQNLGFLESLLYASAPVLMGLERSRVASYRRLIAVSRALRQELIDQYEIPGDRITVVPNGINEDFFEPGDGPAIRKELGIKDDEILLLYLGRLSARKGLGMLLDAFRDLNSENKKIKLVIAGVGDYGPRISSFIKDNCLEKDIIYIGNIPGHKIRSYYACCDIFVLPSLYETFGIVLLEAMSQGKPVVATRIGGIPDVVGEDGIIVEPNVLAIKAGILRLVNEPDLRKRLGEQAKKSARKFLWSSVVKQVEDFYKESLKCIE